MSKRILIVDDEKSVVLALKDVFCAKGYDVLVAFTGYEAAKHLVEDIALDLVLLDIQMPGLNGLEILKEIKEKHNNTKTIILSGFLDEYKDEIEKIGCDAFLSKPFSVKTLINTSEVVLGGKESNTCDFMNLVQDPNVIPKARLLFVEPNEIMYSVKLGYFSDVNRCNGEYEFTVAFTGDEITKKLEEFKPDIILSNINMFHLYKINEKLSACQEPPKDIVLYGLPASKGMDKKNRTSFVSGLFDPVTAAIKPQEMASLNSIVRETAISNGLYRRRESR